VFQTEVIFTTEQHCVSYVQVRGSVPRMCVVVVGLHFAQYITVFWEQQGLQTFGQRIQITRPQASQPAFERHFLQLTEEYGATHAINLLGTKENEVILTNEYGRHLSIARAVFGNDIGITHFDFHSTVRMVGHDNILRELRYVAHSSVELEGLSEQFKTAGLNQ
jgi:synaptojanin